MATATQHAAQQRPFSPLQASPSSNNPTGMVTQPAPKKLKISPSPPSQPASPYVHPGYAGSPSATTPGSAAPNLPSPAPQNYPNPQSAPSQINTPYQQNGRPPNSLPMPSPATPAPSLATPQPQPSTPAPYVHTTFVPTNVGHSNMGPPSIAPSSFSAANDAQKQASKAGPSKGSDYDMNDMLAGTGINLDEEAEKLNDFEIREGFPYHPPGGRDNFYGAGPANQPSQHAEAPTQEELAAEVADEAWNEAARRLTIFRTNELLNHFLEPGIVHQRLFQRASKHGLSLNTELKPDGKSHYMGRVLSPADFPKPEVKVSFRNAPDGTLVQTHGSFIPHEAYLADQIALLSIATKEHMRSLIGEANRVATTRQRTAHGAVPLEWADAAAPQQPNPNGIPAGSPRTGAESAVSPRTNPLKRPADEISNGLPTPVSEVSSPNFLVEALEDVGKEVRNSEEGRLKKRLKRQEKNDEKKDGEDGGSRAGSVAPGTPGSMAPEADAKPMTKKESKKAAKLAEISSTTVNQTLSMFAGGKKKKKYSWMTGGGGPGSGANTPRPQGLSQPGTPGGTVSASSRAPRGPLTRDSAHRLGAFREDSEKGKNIQLRDWVAVLEDRDIDPVVLQTAYDRLDKSDFGDKVARVDVAS
ncbi:hypothetical protein DL770_002216 [Monosporascus sp. CRB-9-2]|nr:hypothetical protein DL770_002216 [Monosporascus sp. CRB-9-2]